MFIRIIDCNEKSFLDRNGRLPRNLQHNPYAADTGVFLLSTEDVPGTTFKYGSILGGMRSLRKDDRLYVIQVNIKSEDAERDRSGSSWPESYFMAGDILQNQVIEIGYTSVLGIRPDGDCVMSEIVT